jgi:hypothetical protein
VGRLADLLHRENIKRQQAAVDEIVGDGSSNADRRGGFSSACADAHQERAQMAFNKAYSELIDTPTILDSADGRSRFIASHPDAPYQKLRQAVDNLHALRYPKPVPEDSPTDQNSDFVKRTRPF